MLGAVALPALLQHPMPVPTLTAPCLQDMEAAQQPRKRRLPRGTSDYQVRHGLLGLRVQGSGAG